MGHVPKQTKTDSQYEWLIFGVDIDKDTLLNNFEKRLEYWLSIGLESEVKNLIGGNISNERFEEIGFEYTLMRNFLEDKISSKELKEKFVQKNWQYAKRQMTWMKKDEEINWINPQDTKRIFEVTENFLNTNKS